LILLILVFVIIKKGEIVGTRVFHKSPIEF